MKTSAKPAKNKAPQSRKPSRPSGNKSTQQQHTRKPARVSDSRNKGTPERSPAAAVPRQSKQATVIALLRRPEGVTVGEIVSAIGWQPHTVRGLFSGTLKKKLRLELNSAQEADRGRVYRISNAGNAGQEAGISA